METITGYAEGNVFQAIYSNYCGKVAFGKAKSRLKVSD